jgi:hypothetical protein
MAEIDRNQRLNEAESAHTSVVAVGIVMAVVGWAGLVWVVLNTVPTVQYRWLGFGLLHLAISGTALPFVRVLNVRFSQDEGLYIKPGTLVRQAMWCGLLGAAAFWLAIPRLFSPALLVVLTITLTVIEVLLRIRENTTYRGE